MNHKIFSSPEEVELITKNSNKVLLVYENDVFDVTNFLHDHPGGASIIEDYNGKDVTEVFHDEDIHEHSQSALKIFYSYKIGELSDGNEENQNKKQEENDIYPKILSDRIIYKNFELDLKRGIICQVFSLNKKNYLDLIDHPFQTNYCRLYDSWYLEILTRNKWYTIAILWGIVINIILYYGITFPYEEKNFLTDYIKYGSNKFSFFFVMLAFILGMIIWTKIEYLLHRFVFHCDWWLPDNKYLLHLHFLLHGIHHAIPMDGDRLVFPPILGVIIAKILFFLFNLIFVGNLARIIFAGFLLGYICYDVIHYYIHHGSPIRGYFKEMKTYHNKHHYKNIYKGYGITSKFWDCVYGTTIE